MPQIHQGNWTAQGKRFAVIVSRWNEFVADKLLEARGALGKRVHATRTSKSIVVRRL